MLISLKNIQQLFGAEETYLKEHTAFPRLTGYTLLENAPIPYSDYLLYVCTSISALQYIHPVTDMHILYFAQASDDFDNLQKLCSASINVLFVKTSNINDALLKLQDFFYNKNIIGLFSEALMDMLFYENGIQAMIDLSYQVFQNPIGVFDADFRLVAACSHNNVPMKNQQSIIDNGGFTAKEYELINKGRIHEKVKRSDVPIHLNHEELGINQYICAIETQKDMGHIVLSETDRPFRSTDYELLIILKKAINQQMKKNEFVRNNKGFPYEYFLRDLLDGKIATPQQSMERLNYTNAAFSGNLYCLVIETARSSNTLNTQHIRILFESAFQNTTTLMYHGEIIIILNLSNNQCLSDEAYAAAVNICQKQGLYGGLSNCFQNIVHLAGFYKQALRAIELGTTETMHPGLFRYSDFYLEHVKNIFAQKENLDTFQHPDLRKLLNYDKENDTNLAYIHYRYLIHERNVVATAAALNLHRNSLQLRMKKINTLISMDYENPHERQYYILSYELYKEHSV